MIGKKESYNKMSKDLKEKIQRYLHTKGLFASKAVSKIWNQMNTQLTRERFASIDNLIDRFEASNLDSLIQNLRPNLEELNQEQKRNLYLALSENLISLNLVNKAIIPYLRHFLSNNALTALSENLICEKEIMDIPLNVLAQTFTDENLDRMRAQRRVKNTRL